MNKSIIIFGVTDLAEILYMNLIYQGITIAAFTVNKEYIRDPMHLGIPVVPFDNLEEDYPPDNYAIYLCVGYREMNTSREKFYYLIKEKGYEIHNYIHPNAIIMTKDIGEGNIIMEGVKIGAFTTLGNCNICYPNALIAHHSKVGSFNFFAISTSIAGNVKIGNKCFFGNNSYTKDGVQIMDSVLVGAGAYVDKDIKEDSVLTSAKSYILENKTSRDFF